MIFLIEAKVANRWLKLPFEFSSRDEAESVIKDLQAAKIEEAEGYRVAEMPA